MTVRAKIFFSVLLILIVAIVVIVIHVNRIKDVSTNNVDFGEKEMELLISRTFGIEMDGNINILEAEFFNASALSEEELIDSFGSDVLFARLEIAVDRRDEIFKEFLHLDRVYEIDSATIHFPSAIRNRLPASSDVNYFYMRFVSVQRRINNDKAVATQSQYVVFMQEDYDNVQVLLYADLAGLEPYGR